MNFTLHGRLPSRLHTGFQIFDRLKPAQLNLGRDQNLFDFGHRMVWVLLNASGQSALHDLVEQGLIFVLEGRAWRLDQDPLRVPRLSSDRLQHTLRVKTARSAGVSEGKLQAL